MASFLKQSERWESEKPTALWRSAPPRSIGEARAADDHVNSVAQLLHFRGEGMAGFERKRTYLSSSP
ncbi:MULTISPECIES: hypothetical protein [unclassified Sphingopyxis]|uniref:hypothetical protein n=1 Tax=unclassified Sphingopyxis TaxID=2614943 RepID=UPI0024AD7D8C|nr:MULTISPECIES: hypothetical protein [unclassified Sphingopyxis]